jgi:hypothetical protein
LSGKLTGRPAKSQYRKSDPVFLISRRCDAARLKLQTDRKLAYAKAQVEKLYHSNIAESQT